MNNEWNCGESRHAAHPVSPRLCLSANHSLALAPEKQCAETPHCPCLPTGACATAIDFDYSICQNGVMVCNEQRECGSGGGERARLELDVPCHAVRRYATQALPSHCWSFPQIHDPETCLLSPATPRAGPHNIGDICVNDVYLQSKENW